MASGTLKALQGQLRQVSVGFRGVDSTTLTKSRTCASQYDNLSISNHLLEHLFCKYL